MFSPTSVSGVPPYVTELTNLFFWVIPTSISRLDPIPVVCETVTVVDPGLLLLLVVVLSTATPCATVERFQEEEVVASAVATGSMRSNACDGSERYNCLKTIDWALETIALKQIKTRRAMNIAGCLNEMLITFLPDSFESSHVKQEIG